MLLNMKTIYTTLPIYDSLAKQAYQRAKRAVTRPPIAISCPEDELPSFQWLDQGDGATSVVRIDLVDENGIVTNITSYFATMPTRHALIADAYFVYAGGALNSSLPCGLGYLKLTTNNALTYYSEWFKAEDVTDYLKIDFYNTCDFYNILYHSGFTQTLWFESETMETSYPIEEEGVKNGEGTFVRTFARQTKKYMVRTLKMPDYMVDVFNRMKLHDTVILTDLQGDENDVYNLEVDHEWLFDDKYYALITLIFDYNETAVVMGCCNNLT